MTDKLPIIEELERATTFTQMAEWLSACPLAIFASHGDKIIDVVKARGFRSGCAYVSEYVAAVHRARIGSFQPPSGGDLGDGSGEQSYSLRNKAVELDSAVAAVGRINLAWHQIHQPSEASNAE